jgi:tetratricopeptide (TPR) repeat protein
MTQATGNNHPRVIAAITEAVNLDAGGQTARAVELLKPLAAELPQAASLRAYLAWFLLRDGQFDDAIKCGGQAVQLSPQSEKASLIYFHALWKAGQRSQALDEMKRFLILRPSSQEYANIIKEWEPNEDETSIGNDDSTCT